MENAVKALIIAAGVLIGIMILSLAASLYSSLNTYVETVQDDLKSKDTQAFNEQFVKYINFDSNGVKEFNLTIQDIVTAANLAHENNLRNQVQQAPVNEYNYRVTVRLDDEIIEADINSTLTEKLAQGLENTNGYRCTVDDVSISTVTGRVYELNFYTIY